MRSFDEILAIAAARKGGVDRVLADIPAPLPPEALAAIPDARWLAEMARGIFRTGLSWAVVEAKWPGIEAAFGGFDIGPLSMMDEARFDALVADPRVIRSGAKIAAIRDNAVFMRRVAAEAGSFARKVADWPAADFAGLLDWLARNGSRLGGQTGAYMLRTMGKESWLLAPDVVARLVAEGVIDGPPSSRRAMAAVQAAFDRWKAESGHDFTTISRVLAQSIGPAG
jgi:3-methyladenine DNA glycosylase Tag